MANGAHSDSGQYDSKICLEPKRQTLSRVENEKIMKKKQ